MEGQWALAGNPLVSLSEQNLMDCSGSIVINGTSNMGCQGGLMANAFQYVINNKGIDTEASYPYQAANGQCHFNPATIGAKINSYHFVDKDPKQMAAQIAAYGPISIAADASLWQYYYTGVWYFPCGTQLDHGILIVGYGTETDILGQEMSYWIVKNSWGASWGMDGYILIERGVDRCGVDKYPITSVVAKK